MRILKWNARSQRQDAPDQFLASAQKNDNNWVTVVVGRNGSKKSLLLRILLEAALRTGSFRIGDNPSISPSIAIESNPSAPLTRVIAISGTPYDRFPRQVRYQTPKTATSYDMHSRYFYLGIKSANGTSGTAQGVRTLAYLLLRAVEEGTEKISAEVFNFLGFQRRAGIVMRRHGSINFSRKESESGRLGSLDSAKLSEAIDRLAREAENLRAELIRPKLTERAAEAATRQIAAIETAIESPHHLHELLAAFPITLEFAFEQSGKIASNANRISLLLALISVGLLVPDHFIVHRIGTAKVAAIVADSDLSSGQWHQLSSMLGLALTAQDGSLILIDEPENSLHPDWQRGYVELLQKTLAHAKGCHVVIATHSPLIASGVVSGSGNILRLVPNEAAPVGVESQVMDIAYGWEAGDAYEQVFGLESTRATSFIDMTDSALAMIRDGQRQTPEFKALVKKLTPIAESLPDYDTMRLVIDAITDKREDRGEQ